MLRVMIADDEYIIRTGLEHSVNTLNNPEVQVVASAKDGLEAYEKAVQYRPDVIITDINMPRCDGLDFIARVKTIESYSPEFIILTGFGEFEYAKSAVELGVSAFILKPVKLDILIDYLKKAEEKIIKSRKVEDQLSDYYEGLPYLQNLFLVNLFTGRISDSALIEQKFMQYKMETKKHFVLAMLNSEVSDSLLNSYFTPPKHAISHFCAVNTRERCFLIFTDHPDTETIYHSLAEFCDRLKAATATPLQVGVSSFYSKNEFYSIAYYEAWEASSLSNEQHVIVFYEAVKGNHSYSREVQVAINIIVRDYSKQISVNDVAEELLISPSHLMHLFKQETGLTFVQYLTEYRMKTAVKMLKTQNYKIYEIANGVGYRDTKHFTKLFKKETGHSPSDYLKKQKPTQT